MNPTTGMNMSKPAWLKEFDGGSPEIDEEFKIRIRWTLGTLNRKELEYTERLIRTGLSASEPLWPGDDA